MLSKTLTTAAWDNTRFLRDLDEVRQLKLQAGKDIHAVGGAALVSALFEVDAVDELRLAIHPIVLGRGKPLFTRLQRRQQEIPTSHLQLEASRPRPAPYRLGSPRPGTSPTST